MSGASIESTASSDVYMVRVSRGRPSALLSVWVEVDSDLRKMGEYEFRVKRIPDPEAYCGGQTDGLISKDKLVAAGSVIPKMKDFDFDVRFRITSFEVTMSVGGSLLTSTANGNRFTAEMKNRIKRLKSGSRVYIENIKAVGPDGVQRKLKPINFKIQ